MPHAIRKTNPLTPTVFRLTIEAAAVAQAAQPGQFVMLRVDPRGERIPLTICDCEPAAGTIDLIVQAAGVTTMKICRLKAGETITDIAGPLGNPTSIRRYGAVLGVAGGVGIAELYPVLRACKEAGNAVIAIVGVRSRNNLILESQLRDCSDKLIIASDDGSIGNKGLVGDSVAEFLSECTVDIAFTVGPAAMMQRVAALTRPREIRTIASLNTIMVDGTGMCGSCRVTVAGQTRFVCVDGPDFDAHEVDFEELKLRQRRFKSKEQIASHRCRLGEV